MTAFGNGIHGQYPESRLPSGIQRSCAVKCWFTASGRMMPLTMKLEDEEGQIREIKELEILQTEQKYYAGVCTWEYRCRFFLGGTYRVGTLQFQPERCRWKLYLWAEGGKKQG